MTERYEPPSFFLRAVIADAVPLAGSPEGEANLGRLIAMTRDPEVANRDWAVLLLSQQETDTPQVRSALLEAARDSDEIVRAEAILGIALRDPALALPLLQEALAGPRASAPLFEAAVLVAHPSLAHDLRAFAEPSDNAFLDERAAEALAACEGRT